VIDDDKPVVADTPQAPWQATGFFEWMPPKIWLAPGPVPVGYTTHQICVEPGHTLHQVSELEWRLVKVEQPTKEQK
jgi:hypothetical protein